MGGLEYQDGTRMGLLDNQESVFGCTDQKDEKGSVGETPVLDSQTRASKLEAKAEQLQPRI